MSEKKQLKLKWFSDSLCVRSTANVLTFGETVDAGKSVEKTFYLKNITEDEIDQIRITVEDPEVDILAESKSLLPNQSMAVAFTWSPKITRETALQSIIHVRMRVIKKPR